MKGDFLNRRFKVIDGLVVAACALLALKVLAFLATPAETEKGADGLPTFGRVIAHARTNYSPPDPDTTGSVPEKDAKPPAAAAPAAPPSPAKEEAPEAKGSPSERAIRERLGERREELQQKSRDIEAREKLLEEAERRADARAEETRKAEERGGGPSSADKEAASLKGLVTMYETMKPKDAARVFDRLPHEVLVPVVRLIAPRKMAEIMAAMTPESAQKLTVALARPAKGENEPVTAPGLPPGELPAIDAPGAARPRTRAN